MQIFDALVGNNDRHFYNWGVIEDITHKKDPFFAPVYDTARGLFWNFSEERLKRMISSKGAIDRVQLHKYANKSMPKIGWEASKKVAHFQMIQQLYTGHEEFRHLFHELINEDRFQSILSLIHTRFKPYLSPERLILIQECLIYRYRNIHQIIS